MVMFLEAYFDESYSDDGDEFFCVAGYVFNKNECGKLDTKWKITLQEYGLEYFRMSSCAHGNEPFGHQSIDERVSVQTKMFQHINTHAAFWDFYVS
jgi:hypothetical protein